MARRIHRIPRAFSLVELLAACAVFMVLAVLLLQIVGSITSTSDFSQRRLETLRYAVAALERLDFDLRETIRTGGSTLFVAKGDATNINDSLYFLAPAATSARPTAPRKLALIKYGIEGRPDQQPDFGSWPSMPTFSRTVKPFGWDDDIGKFLPLTGTTVAAASPGGEVQQISPSVIRCEICFQHWDGSISNQPPTDWREIRALVIGVVAIDRKAALRLSPQDRSALAGRFSKAADNKRPTSQWDSSIRDLPAGVRENIRFYEQTISI